jgi:DnaD/phage-associated family protein
MANKRLIYQDMFEDDEVGMMPVEVRLLWVGLITAVADDQGRLIDNASLIKSKVFVYDSDITEAMINNWLKLLQDAEMIIRYKSGNKKLIQISKWWDYQTPSWASESKYAAPPTWVDRVKVHTIGNKVKVINWDKTGGLSNDVRTDVPTPVDSLYIKGDVKGEGDIEDDIDIEAEPVSTTTAGAVFSAYEHEIGVITPQIAERLKDASELYPESWLIDAFKIASEKNARNMKYVDAILQRWKAEGKDNGKCAAPVAVKKPDRKAHTGAELANAWGAK